MIIEPISKNEESKKNKKKKILGNIGENGIKKKRRNKNENENYESKDSIYEQPLLFDFLLEEDFKKYNDFVNFCENNFSNIDIKEVNNVINKLRKEKNEYLLNYLSSSSEEESTLSSDEEKKEKKKIVENKQKKNKEYKKNLKLINIKKNKKARINLIIIKKKYVEENDKKNTVIISPLFMPVGTKCCIKGLIEEEVKSLCNYVILSNTYHLSNIYDMSVFQNNKNINSFIRFPNSMLTDSGGFQMVSLSKRIKILEEGILFNNIYDSSIIKRNINLCLQKNIGNCSEINSISGKNTEMIEKNKYNENEKYLNIGEDILLSPEVSIKLQNIIGSDIIMALDDVRPAKEKDIKQIEESTDRTNRWLKRCIKSHLNKKEQSLFGIIQGGLHIHLRNKSMDYILRKKLNGYAVGGLCGGEKKRNFIKIIHHCSNEKNKKYNYLPINKCRYIMGIGYLVDIVFCSLLGYDMYDCVYPSRTARFNTALSHDGTVKLKQSKYKFDFTPLEKNCNCYVCKKYTKSALHLLISKKNPITNILLTIHNIYFTLYICYLLRVSIFANKVDQFVTTFLYNYFVIGHKNGNYKIPDKDINEDIDNSNEMNYEENKNEKLYLNKALDNSSISYDTTENTVNNYINKENTFSSFDYIENEENKKHFSSSLNHISSLDDLNKTKFTNEADHKINLNQTFQMNQESTSHHKYDNLKKEKLINELKQNLPQWALEALKYADIELKF
ncbi:queuine tRNA-ribosyltransferase, putative [Plasmodium relictum]|uniref:Queuine tRNA-ribosyltransferase, putative n=1 Tax=Plasmodium relictum TaxID=85471 RepID=A0A1J1H234_PLARL|nr:queuine tRNA-ribosyltransferase, putative [Plasmodium relictum]CRG98622.1 queuine tRNA-ribosyltransferase, putative [Plasmodium relictum]